MATETISEAPKAWLKTEGFQSLKASVSTSLPATFLDGIPKLNNLQAGHLRHIQNLASSLPGEWPHMGAQDPAQEWLDALRYQLATMSYTLGAAHYHHLPGLRSTFKLAFEKLIEKMLRREVWGYWYLTSQSGKFVDPDIEELRRPWADPIKRENIMYSGHLLLMVSLYAMLFNSSRYEEENALVFNWNPVFFGMGPESFGYSQKTLQQAIIDEMERNGWIGVCCEPNCVFVVCNQFPLIAMRYNDVRHGNKTIEEVLPRYKAAWAAQKMHAPDGLIVDMYRIKQQKTAPAVDIGFTAWAGTFMNSWNQEEVRELFPTQVAGFMTRTSVSPNLVTVNIPPIAQAIRSMVASSPGLDPYSLEVFHKARDIVASSAPGPRPPFSVPSFGYLVQWLSELGNQELLDGMLNHANTFFKPTWENGGLFYTRCDQDFDQDGNWTSVDPYTGNSAIGYSRLNVADGQKKMWDKPWTASKVDSEPILNTTSFEEHGVDFTRAGWVEELNAFVVTARTWHGRNVRVDFTFENLPEGNYAVYVQGSLQRTTSITGKDRSLKETIEIGGVELDVVLLQFGDE